MASLEVVQLKVGTVDNFVYLLVDEESKEALVVDSDGRRGRFWTRSRQQELA